MTKQNQGHSVDMLLNTGFWMRKRRRTYRLADTAAIVIAALLLGVDLMVRDPQASVAAAAPQGDPALTITLIFMAFGLCVTMYGLYHERHKVRAHVIRRLEIRLRFARREVSYNPGLRRLARLQLSLNQAAR